MVSIVIGMIVIAGALALASRTLGANTSQIRNAKLNAEVAKIVQLVGQDLRRHCFTGAISTTTPSACGNFATSTTNPITYNLDSSGTLESFQYALSGAQLSVKVNGSATSSPINDTTVVSVNQFQLTPVAASLTCSVDAQVQIRPLEYVLTVGASLTADSTVGKTFTQTIRVRNDLVQTWTGTSTTACN